MCQLSVLPKKLNFIIFADVATNLTGDKTRQQQQSHNSSTVDKSHTLHWSTIQKRYSWLSRQSRRNNVEKDAFKHKITSMQPAHKEKFRLLYLKVSIRAKTLMQKLNNRSILYIFNKKLL